MMMISKEGGWSVLRPKQVLYTYFPRLSTTISYIIIIPLNFWSVCECMYVGTYLIAMRIGMLIIDVYFIGSSKTISEKIPIVYCKSDLF